MTNQDIFREYDIRGIADVDLSHETTSRLGRAIGTYLKRHGCKVVTLGRDCRLSSPRISSELQEGLLSSGLDVWDISLVPTPLSYFSVNTLPVDGGVMITASHNPPEYNGVKISLGRTTIFGNEIQEVKRILLREDFVSGHGSYRTLDIREKYIQAVLDSISHPIDLKVVMDSGNGMAGMIAPELFRQTRLRGCRAFFPARRNFSEPPTRSHGLGQYENTD